MLPSVIVLPHNVEFRLLLYLQATLLSHSHPLSSIHLPSYEHVS